MASPNHLRSSKACGAKYGAGSRAAALPNPSVKASANGRPGYSQLLFLLPPGLPLAPPYLERSASKKTSSSGLPLRTAKNDGERPGTGCYPCDVKVSEILRLLQQDGWTLVATRGSHRQYKHGFKPGRVTVPGKPSDDLALGTQNSILKQAGLK